MPLAGTIAKCFEHRISATDVLFNSHAVAIGYSINTRSRCRSVTLTSIRTGTLLLISPQIEAELEGDSAVSRFDA